MKFICALFLTLFLTLALSAPAFAQGAVPVWSIVKGDGVSRIAFEGTQMGAAFDGEFHEFDGNILFDPADLPGSKAMVTIHLDSVDAHSGDRTKYLPMADWFNTAKFPVATFVTTAIDKGLDTNQYVARGDLTIRDITLPVTLPFTLTITGDQAVMTGETSINRVDFGVGQGQWSDVKTVGADVKIKIKLTATRK